MKRHRIMKALKIATMAVAGITLAGLVVERLWNWLAPTIFGGHTITFWQALGLLLLSKILFGGFHRHTRRGSWKRRMDRRWASMSPEEKERFKAGLHKRVGCRWKQGEASPLTGEGAQ